MLDKEIIQAMGDLDIFIKGKKYKLISHVQLVDKAAKLLMQDEMRFTEVSFPQASCH